MGNHFSYSRSVGRITKRERAHEQLNDEILLFLRAAGWYVNAEILWLEMRTNGHYLSISSFYSRLRELVGTAVIEKKRYGGNRYLYKIAS